MLQWTFYSYKKLSYSQRYIFKENKDIKSGKIEKKGDGYTFEFWIDDQKIF